ncbi:MAG: DUF3175 domain-containing protein [Steroidobacteraceae bacterium]
MGGIRDLQGPGRQPVRAFLLLRHSQSGRPALLRNHHPADPVTSRGKSKRRSTKRGARWSKRVLQTSAALDLEPGVFTQESPRQIALSLKRSAESSRRGSGGHRHLLEDRAEPTASPARLAPFRELCGSCAP